MSEENLSEKRHKEMGLDNDNYIYYEEDVKKSIKELKKELIGITHDFFKNQVKWENKKEGKVNPEFFDNLNIRLLRSLKNNFGNKLKGEGNE